MRLTALVVAGWFVVAFNLAPAQRPDWHGIRLAYPVKLPTVAPRPDHNHYSYEFVRRLTLAIDSTGRVSGILSVSPPDSFFVAHYEAYYRDMVFAPGNYAGHSVSQRLPVVARVNPRSAYPVTTFPIDSAGVIGDGDLYFAALEANGALLPHIKSYPSYFYRSPGADSLAGCPYLLVKLTLDERGHPLEITPLTTAGGDYADQILTAVNWGRYAPGRTPAGETIKECFLVVSFIPGVIYPTARLDAGDDKVALLNRVRVRLVSDTLALMRKPVPRNVPPGSEYLLPGGPAPLRDTCGLRVAIDTVGHATLLKAIGAAPRAREIFELIVDSLDFCPAVDWSGRAKNYEGLLLCEYAGSTKIRIRFCWLSGECFRCSD